MIADFKRSSSIKYFFACTREIILISFRLRRRCSSVVEHFLGKEGVACPIHASGTIKKLCVLWTWGFFNNPAKPGKLTLNDRSTVFKKENNQTGNVSDPRQGQAAFDAKTAGIPLWVSANRGVRYLF